MASILTNTLLDLNGGWTAGGPEVALITVMGSSLTIDMSAFHRPAASGSIVDSSTITVTFPDDNTYTGTLQSSGAIQWSSGSAWTKLTVAPEHIIQIVYTNPPLSTDPNWAKQPDGSIPGFGGEFPFPPSEQDWQQVLSPNDEYELDAIGASGWVVNPEQSGADLPFTHPFGTDWEFALAVDQPSDDPTKYTSLLSAGSQAAKQDAHGDLDAFQAASQFGIPVPNNGLLGVEWDGNLVPKSFKRQVRTGDRAAVYGRWILDTGHTFNSSFRTEIHPPLLLAVGGVRPEIDGSQGTHVVFTSRPYLVGQTFVTDTGQIYNDGAHDDGHFFMHMLNEVRKLDSIDVSVPIVDEDVPIPGIPSSASVEAHPKIKTYPFQGVHLVHFVIRPPALDHGASPTSFHGPAGLASCLGPIAVDPYYLSISFHFTVRSGCAVQVTSTAADTIDVFVALNNVDYTPPPLPARQEVVLNRDDLKKLNSDAASYYLDVEILNAAIQALALGNPVSAIYSVFMEEKGITTDVYDAPPDVNVLDSNNAVISTSINNIPAGQGITVNDDQPYPFYGWLDAKWVKGLTIHEP